MKNKYLKYTLLSIAISSSLLLTSCGCGKKSEPLNEASTDTTAIEETTTDENTTELENNESMETVTNADRGEAEGETTTSTEENTQGVVIQFEEGEYTGTNPDEPIIETETAEPEQEYEDPGLSVAIQNLKGLYDQGLLTEDEYKEMVAAVTSASQEMAEESSKPSSNTSGGYSQAELDAETQARLDAMSNDDLPPTDNNLDIEYGQADNAPEHLKGDIIGN